MLDMLFPPGMYIYIYIICTTLNIIQSDYATNLNSGGPVSLSRGRHLELTEQARNELPDYVSYPGMVEDIVCEERGERLA